MRNTIHILRVFSYRPEHTSQFGRLVWLLLATNILGASLALSADYAPPSQGLVGWWRGEGNGVDSANGHNGTLQSGVTFQPGAFGQAFSFVGNANRVEIPDGDDFKLTNSLTIAAWIYPKANSWLIFFRGDSRLSQDPYALSLDNTGKLVFRVQSLQNYEQVTAPIALNKWQHATGTLDGTTGEMRLYLDGVLVDQKTTSVRPFAELLPAYRPQVAIGNNSDGTYPFIGLIDEVVLYSRALLPTEVTNLVTGIPGLPPSILVQPKGQTGYWGKSVTLSVSAKGTAPLQYLWYKDGVPISWATNSSLTLDNLEMPQSGDYSVVVTNEFGSATSQSAWLTVNPAGVLLGLYPGVEIDGVVGKTYGIQYVTNVTHTNDWITLTNITLTQPVQLWVDTNTNVKLPNQPQKFYRVIAVP